MKNHVDIGLFDVLTRVLNGSYRRVSQCVILCILISEGCPMCIQYRRVVQCVFNIGGLPNVFQYQRVVQCVLISEGCPIGFDIGGLSNGMIYKTKIFCFEKQFSNMALHLHLGME